MYTNCVIDLIAIQMQRSISIDCNNTSVEQYWYW